MQLRDNAALCVYCGQRTAGKPATWERNIMADIFSAAHAIAHQHARRQEAPRPANPALAATVKQVEYIGVLLEQRDWRADDLPAKNVSRCAVLRAAITWAQAPSDRDVTPPAVADLLGDAPCIGDRVNVILEFLRTAPETVGYSGEDDEYLWRDLTKEGASKLIEWLKGLPQYHGSDREHRVEQSIEILGDETTPNAETVPAGRYAIDTYDGAHNDIAFYKVDRPTEGKWAGYVFVKLMVSDEEQRLPHAAARGVLRRIAEVGAEAASARYGQEIGECGVCGRTLTNDESRERGIGPKCAAGMGW